MHLYGIGIYIESKSDKNTLVKYQSAQHDTGESGYKLFSKKPVNELENIDQLLLDSDFYQQMPPDFWYKQKHEGREFNHIFNSSFPKCVMAVSCDRFLKSEEKSYLFKNIAHVLLRPDKVKVTLSDIVAQPLNYIGRDLLIGCIDKEMQLVKKKVEESLIKVIKRGENIEQLQSKTVILDDHAKEFGNKAKELNRCCRVW